jgi:hypothetical protein
MKLQQQSNGSPKPLQGSASKLPSSSLARYTNKTAQRGDSEGRNVMSHPTPLMLPSRPRGSPSPRPFSLASPSRTVTSLALPDSASAIDVVNTASDLIMRASEGALPVHTHNVSQFINALHHAMGELGRD